MVKSVSLTQLKSQLKTHVIKIKNPFYAGSPVLQYSAWSLKDVLALAQCDLNRTLMSEAEDGYRQTVTAPEAAAADGFIAYEQKNGWAPIGNKNSSPGPFFIVWNQPHKKLGWPYQLKALHYKSDEHLTDLPAASQAPQSVTRGHKLFNEKCVACHQVGDRGGDLGPNLTLPHSVTEYMSRPFLKKYILDRTTVRKYDKSMMPQFKNQMSDSDIDAVISYLEWFDKKK